MKTYLFIKTNSPKRGMDVRISVYRVKHNQPQLIGCSDHQTASWMGERTEAVRIIHDFDRIPYGTKRNGTHDSYTLRGMIGFANMYDDSGPHHRNAVRLFECSGALQ